MNAVMTQKNATIAIIGSGNIGRIVAANLVKGNRAVILADRNPAKAADISANLGSLVTSMEVGAAISQADIIVFAVYFQAIKELLKQYAKELEGKLLVDPSNPIAPDGKGGFTKIIDAGESAGHILAGLLPAKAT